MSPWDVFWFLGTPVVPRKKNVRTRNTDKNCHFNPTVRITGSEATTNKSPSTDEAVDNTHSGNTKSSDDKCATRSDTLPDTTKCSSLNDRLRNHNVKFAHCHLLSDRQNKTACCTHLCNFEITKIMPSLTTELPKRYVQKQATSYTHCPPHSQLS